MLMSWVPASATRTGTGMFIAAAPPKPRPPRLAACWEPPGLNSSHAATAAASNNRTMAARRRLRRGVGVADWRSGMEYGTRTAGAAIVPQLRPFTAADAWPINTSQQESDGNRPALPGRHQELHRDIWKAMLRATCWGLASPSWAEKRIQIMYLLALISGKTP